MEVVSPQIHFQTEALREFRKKWFLLNDVDLLHQLESFSKGLVSTAHLTLRDIEGIERDLNETKVEIKTISNNFHAVADSQFIENRVFDEDDSFLFSREENRENVSTSGIEKEWHNSLRNCITILKNKSDEPVSSGVFADICPDDLGKRNITFEPNPRISSLLPYTLDNGFSSKNRNFSTDEDFHGSLYSEKIVLKAPDNVSLRSATSRDESENVLAMNFHAESRSLLEEIRQETNSSEYEDESSLDVARKQNIFDNVNTAVKSESSSENFENVLNNVNYNTSFDSSDGSSVAKRVDVVGDHAILKDTTKVDFQSSIGKAVLQSKLFQQIAKAGNLEDSDEESDSEDIFDELKDKSIKKQPTYYTRDNKEKEERTFMESVRKIPEHSPRPGLAGPKFMESVRKSSENSPHSGLTGPKLKESVHKLSEEGSLSGKLDKTGPSSAKMEETNDLPNVSTEILTNLGKTRPRIQQKRRLPSRRKKEEPQTLQQNESRIEEKEEIKKTSVILSPSTDEEDLFLLPGPQSPHESFTKSLFDKNSLFSPGSSLQKEFPGFSQDTKDEGIIFGTTVSKKIDIFESNIKKKINLFQEWDPFKDTDTLFSERRISKKENNGVKLFEDKFDSDEDDLFSPIPRKTSNTIKSSLFNEPFVENPHTNERSQTNKFDKKSLLGFKNDDIFGQKRSSSLKGDVVSSSKQKVEGAEVGQSSLQKRAFTDPLISDDHLFS